MERKKRKCYSEALLSEAITAVSRGMSIYQASKQYHIPETTLRDKRDGKYPNNKPGQQPVLTLSEETKIVDWIHYLGRAGFPVTKEQLLDVIAKLVKNLNRTNPFKDGVPGRYWFEGFMKRHPTVSKRVAQNLPTTRNQLTEENIRAWFERVRAYFEANGLLYIFEEPQRIFNCDETGFFLCPKEKQVLVKRGSKRVYNRVANDEKECLTVLVTVAADGEIAPPMVLFPYKRVPPYIKASVPSWWGLGNTDSGWMSMEAFYEYVTNVFFPWLLQKKITLPVVLFLDGHTSHISLPLTTFCKEKGIILVALLPNSTHVLQPLDVAVFRPVKGTWRTVVHNFRVENNYAKLTREEFSKTVQKCFDICLKPDTIKSGFQCCGICPFDPLNIKYDKLLEKSRKHASKEAPAPVIATSSKADKDELFKKDFESRLSPVTLFAFQNTENEWAGDLQYKKLFSYWKNITTCEAVNQPLELGDTTLKNNIDQENVSELVMNYQVGDDDILFPENVGVEVDSVVDPLIPLTQEMSDRTLTPQITQDTQQSASAILSERQVSLTSVTSSPITSMVLTSPAKKCLPKVKNLSSRPVPSLIPLPSNLPRNSVNRGNKKQELLVEQTLNPYKKDTSEPLKTMIKSLKLPKEQEFAQNPVLISLEKLLAPGESSCTDACDEQEFLRSSTPQLDKALSPKPVLSISDIEGSDDESIFYVKPSHLIKNGTQPEKKKLHQNQDTISEKSTPVKSSMTDNKSKINEKDASDKTFVPTPFKQLPTPFKNAFYFPKKEEKHLKKKVYKKVTPTVATSEEFMEHQRRIDSEKAEKILIKQQKKQAALKKREERDLINKNKKQKTLKKKEERDLINKNKKDKHKNTVIEKKRNTDNLIENRVPSPTSLPSTSCNRPTHDTPDDIGIFSAQNNTHSDDDSRNRYTNISTNKVKRRCFFDSDSENSSS